MIALPSRRLWSLRAAQYHHRRCATIMVKRAASSETTNGAAIKGKRSKKEPEEPKEKYDEVRHRPPPYPGQQFRVLSWNVAGLWAMLNKDGETLRTLVESNQANVLCIQEHKLQEAKVPEVKVKLEEQLPGWTSVFDCSTVRKGYAGVAMLFRPGVNPLSVSRPQGPLADDNEGRVLVAEFETMYVVTVYVPNSGKPKPGDKDSGLERLAYRVDPGGWDCKLAQTLKTLEKHKPVILGGDLNVAYQEIDIHSPKTNQKSAGFTPQERESFGRNYLGNGFVDTFRRQHPDLVGYTYFSRRFPQLRTQNRGWRLDYWLVSESLYPAVHDCFHLRSVMGSDHVPLGLVVKMDV